jgi:hypothetical protein
MLLSVKFIPLRQLFALTTCRVRQAPHPKIPIPRKCVDFLGSTTVTVHRIIVTLIADVITFLFVAIMNRPVWRSASCLIRTVYVFVRGPNPRLFAFLGLTRPGYKSRILSIHYPVLEQITKNCHKYVKIPEVKQRQHKTASLLSQRHKPVNSKDSLPRLESIWFK